MRRQGEAGRGKSRPAVRNDLVEEDALARSQPAARPGPPATAYTKSRGGQAQARRSRRLLGGPRPGARGGDSSLATVQRTLAGGPSRRATPGVQPRLSAVARCGFTGAAQPGWGAAGSPLEEHDQPVAWKRDARWRGRGRATPRARAAGASPPATETRPCSAALSGLPRTTWCTLFRPAGRVTHGVRRRSRSPAKLGPGPTLAVGMVGIERRPGLNLLLSDRGPEGGWWSGFHCGGVVALARLPSARSRGQGRRRRFVRGDGLDRLARRAGSFGSCLGAATSGRQLAERGDCTAACRVSCNRRSKRIAQGGAPERAGPWRTPSRSRGRPSRQALRRQIDGQQGPLCAGPRGRGPGWAAAQARPTVRGLREGTACGRKPGFRGDWTMGRVLPGRWGEPPTGGRRRARGSSTQP